jgi:hypothetical protein
MKPVGPLFLWQRSRGWEALTRSPRGRRRNGKSARQDTVASTVSKWAENNMEPILLAWVYLIINVVEVTALGVVLWQLFRRRRDVMVMLRVLRRIDRKIVEPAHQA